MGVALFNTVEMFFEIRSLQPELKPEQDSQLTLYHILVPIFGGFIIIINLAVVVSSGLILKKREYYNNSRGMYVYY